MVKVPADSASAGASFQVLTAVFLLCPHRAEEVREPSGVSCQGMNPVHKALSP